MFDPEFFPTPGHVAAKMLSRVSPNARHFLEPSAGRGDLAQAIRNRFGRADIDCIEPDPELAAILTSKGFKVVGYDWMDYAGTSYYDAIIMNPPFSVGAEHLLRAWDFLHHGEIVCLLNAETLRNPHTASRKRLAEVIREHGEVEHLGACFAASDRPTDVEVAMVHLRKDSEDDRIDLWAIETEERTARGHVADDNALAIIDRLGNMQHYYDKANEHMLTAFSHIRKAALYMDANDAKVDLDHILPLAARNVNEARAEFLQAHRLKAWMSVFDQTGFHKWLDKKQKGDFIRDVQRDGNIPFTKENIRGTLENVFLQRGRLFEQSVANVFDMLTRYFKGNTNHTEGWKSNESYKVNEKLVFPYGCSYEGNGSFAYFSAWSRMDVYNDIDRVLCVLDGKDFDKCLTVGNALQDAFRDYRSTGSNKTESDYFEIRFFKKGTVHLKFKRRDLWAAFNVAAAKGKAWLGEDHNQKAA